MQSRRSTQASALRLLIPACLLTMIAPASAAAPPAPLTVEQVSDQSGAAIVVTQAEAHHRLRVYVTPDAKGAPQIFRAEAGTLAGPDNDEVLPTLKSGERAGASIEIPVTQPQFIEVEVTAQLQRFGEYRGWVVFKLGGEAPQIHPLRIQRTEPDLPLTVLMPERVRNESCLLGGWWQPASLWFTVQGSSDRQWTVATTSDNAAAKPEKSDQFVVTPRLTALDRTVPGAVKTQDDAPAPSFSLDDAGKPQQAAIDGKRVRMSLQQCVPAGEYSGRVTLSAPGFKPASHTFALAVRNVFWIAALFVGLGAVASMCLKRYGNDIRPRLIARQRIALLHERLRLLAEGPPPFDPDELRTLEALRQQVEVISGEAWDFERLTDNWGSEALNRLAAIALKIDQLLIWVDARRLAYALNVQTQSVRDTLSSLQRALASAVALTDQQKTALDELPQQIHAAWKTELTQKIDDLWTTAERQHSTETPEPARQQAWSNLFDRLRASREALNTGEAAAVSREFQQARLAFVQLLAGHLQQQAGAPAPEGVAAEEWDKVKADVAAATSFIATETSADAAAARYEQTYRKYLQVVLAGLELLTKNDLRATAEALGNITPEALTAFRTEIDDARKLAQKATTLVAQAKLTEAFNEYQAAANKRLAAWKALPKRQGDGREAFLPEPVPQRVAGGASPPATVGDMSAIPPRRAPAFRIENPVELRARTRAADLAIDLVSLVIAVVMGVLILWWPNQIWGGLGDWLTALLWGLGLHQVSGATFEGVLGLRDKLIR